MAEQSKLKVVVGVDFGPTSDVAIAEALRLAKCGAVSELHAVYVLDPDSVPDGIREPALVRENEVLARAPSHLRERVADIGHAMQIRLRDFETFVHARIGKHAEAIHQVAVDYDADLIIVGNHGRKGIDRLVLGSVSEKLARTAHCPVLVARPKDYSGLEKSERPEPPREGSDPGRDPGFELELNRSTERVSWSPSESDGPTGFRIV